VSVPSRVGALKDFSISACEGFLPSLIYLPTTSTGTTTVPHFLDKSGYVSHYDSDSGGK